MSALLSCTQVVPGLNASMARMRWKVRAKWHSIMEYSAFPFDTQARSRPQSRPHISRRDLGGSIDPLNAQSSRRV